MKSRIETKYTPSRKSPFGPRPFESFRELVPPECQENETLHKHPDESAGVVNRKFVSERAGRPLKMVLFARVDSLSPAPDAGAWRALIKALCARGHRLVVLERDYLRRKKHELPTCAQSLFYSSFKHLKERFTPAIRNADFVMIGSTISDAAAIGEWVTQAAQGTTAFYDLNTPVTLAKLNRGDPEYFSPSLLSRFHLYLSFTGGPLLDLVKRYYGTPLVRTLYGCVDASLYYPEKTKLKFDLGYIGNFSEDRSPGVDELILEPARRWPAGRFAVAGQGFPHGLDWPKNVQQLSSLFSGKERRFYNAQKFTLNVTGTEMIDAGFSPSLRILEAAACGTPIISDYWEGLESFFEPDEEILFAKSAEEALDYLRGIHEDERLRIGDNARRRILAEHSCEQRAMELESYAMEAKLKV